MVAYARPHKTAARLAAIPIGHHGNGPSRERCNAYQQAAERWKIQSALKVRRMASATLLTQKRR